MEFFRYLGVSDFWKVLVVQHLFRTLGRDIARFQKRTRLGCQPGCGRCCEGPHVETTVLEMMPLAAHLWQKGEASRWLETVEKAGNPSPCVFYQPDPAGQGKGRCSVYPLRPLICRLFGFSANRDKQGHRVLMTCARIKENQTADYLDVQKHIDSGLPVPVMSDYILRVSPIDPVLGQKQVPINDAIHRAIERIGLRMSLRSRR